MITVVICTHNPRPQYWRRVIAALEAQTLDPEAWELVVIDNASTAGAVSEGSLGHLPNARVVAEPTVGLTPARLRGIAEARGELLVFVDDDNLLAPDYLLNASAIAKDYPFLGAFGGNIIGEYESPPPEWAIPFLGYLAVVNVAQVTWSNASPRNPSCPRGAGMCVLASVADHYASLLATAPIRRLLDRTGSNLSSCGDSDLALVACDVGLGVGLLPQLTLTHLIPASRLEIGYLTALVHGIHRSQAILAACRGEPLLSIRSGRFERVLRALTSRPARSNTQRLLDAAASGREEGILFTQSRLACD